MGKRINAALAEQWRAALREGYSVGSIAALHNVNPATVKKHASFDVGGHALLEGTEVHIDGQRGRWRFVGGIGHAKDGTQYATFINARTGRSRIFYTRLITTVHRG